MPVQIGAKLDSGFDDPLGMLQDCHRRIERFLVILCDVAERAHARSLTGGESDAVRAALAYFRDGGRRHTADEEESLFPRMRALSSAAALDSISHLEDDHREADSLHNDIDRLYTNWISTGAVNAANQASLLEKTRRLRALYAQHIEAEETTVFPHAARVLDSEAVRAIGAEFRARRTASR